MRTFDRLLQRKKEKAWKKSLISLFLFFEEDQENILLTSDDHHFLAHWWELMLVLKDRIVDPPSTVGKVVIVRQENNPGLEIKSKENERDKWMKPWCQQAFDRWSSFIRLFLSFDDLLLYGQDYMYDPLISISLFTSNCLSSITPESKSP